MTRAYQKEILLRHLNEKQKWVFSYALEGIQTKYGWLGSQADRRARELAGQDWKNPEFEYRGEYRGIEYVISGRIVSRCRQYRVEILDGVHEAPKQAEAKQVEVKPEAEKLKCCNCGKGGFIAPFRGGYYCGECIKYSF